MHTSPARLALACAALAALPTFAQYTPSAGKNAPPAAYDVRTDPTTGRVVLEKSETRAVTRDRHGNARGNQYDLAVDGAFAGQTVLIIDQVGNTLENTRRALKEKGLASVVYPPGLTPPVAQLRADLEKSCQVWLISNDQPRLSDEHLTALKAFFDAGHGVYVWGDNDPYYTDANRLASTLVPGLRMEGDLRGNQVVGVADGKRGKAGLRAGHLITTGLEHLYEGVTIATVQFHGHDGKNLELYDGPGGVTRSPRLPDGFTPLLYGSAGNLVTVAYEKDGKRLVMDGGFTRLAVNWDDAGTARYVKNAAAWLVHAERFQDTVAVRRDGK
ncbi:MAG: phosphoribosyltransferase [Myxococcota bacterium]